MAGLTCLTDLDGVVLNVADRSDRSLAVKGNETNLSRGKADLSHAVLLSHKLCICACGTDKLRALTGVELDAVDDGTDGDISDRKCVAHLDIGVGTGINGISCLQAFGSDDVALLALGVGEECDVCGTVRIVLDADYGSRAVYIALEVYDTILLLVSAAVMTNGDTTVAVTAGMLFESFYKALFGSKLCKLFK